LKSLNIYISIVLLLACISLQAQHKHEFSAYAGGGMSTLKYNTIEGKQKNNTGSLFGFGYTHFVSPKIGLNTSIEFSFYNAEAIYDNLSDRYMTNDINNDAFEYRTTVNDYEEKQRAAYLNIPLMVQYQFPTKKHLFYAAAGGKIGLPLSGTYQVKKGIMKNSGYYEEEDYEYTTQEFLGFGTFRAKESSEELDFKISFMLSAEAGMKWKLKDDLYLYTGAYIDYGLNNIRKNEGVTPLVSYNRLRPQDPILNSVLTSQYLKDGGHRIFTDKVAPMAIGIKVKIAFGVSKKYTVVTRR